LAGTFFILHEPLTPLILLGAGLTIVGVHFAAMKKEEKIFLPKKNWDRS
jgi:drug/metabolite transporter (DMT)-like permease